MPIQPHRKTNFLNDLFTAMAQSAGAAEYTKCRRVTPPNDCTVIQSAGAVELIDCISAEG